MSLMVLVRVDHGQCMGIFGGTLIGRRLIGRIRRNRYRPAMEMFGGGCSSHEAGVLRFR